MTGDLFALDATDNPLRFRWTPSSRLFTPGSTLQGGAGLGAAVRAMEAATGRPLIWATAQYLSFAALGGEIELTVTIEVAGHNTTQARCVVSRDGNEILTTHGALGSRKVEIDGVWCTPPDVGRPDDCEPFRFFVPGRGDLGDLVEVRLARGRQLVDVESGRGAGDATFWVRCWTGIHHVTVPDLALIGDFMPLGFADAVGARYAGNSLDNTIRVGQLAPTEWILLATHVQQVANGFGYGRAELWADDGTLLGEVSQSAVLRHHDSIHRRTAADKT